MSDTPTPPPSSTAPSGLNQTHERELQLARALIRGSNDAIVSQTLEGVVETWNPGAERLYGYAAQEVIGRHLRFLLLPQDQDAEALLLARVRSGESVPNYEATRQRKDGSLVEVSINVSPIVDDAGQVVGVSKIARDVSYRRVKASMQHARERAEHMAAARSSFLATMSHELRTPMNAVLGFTSLLMDTPLTDEQRGHLVTVQNAARGLLRLLNDILDVARLEKGHLQLDEQDHDLHELLAGLRNSFAAAAQAKGLALSTDVLPDVPRRVHGDALRLQQILANLLDNAVKFTTQGQVRLRVERAGDQLWFHVSDTGPGMPAEQLEQLFEPFTQGDGSLQRRFGGTGLGTALCKQLTQLMGGDIRVQSTPGEGSVFTVRLPLRLPADGTAIHEDGPAVGEVSPCSVADQPLVDEAAALEIWGGMREVWVDGLQMFVEHLPGHRAHIDSALTSGDIVAAIAPVHALRGSASTLGLQALSQLLSVIEHALRQGDLAMARSCGGQLPRLLDQTEEALLPVLQAPAGLVAEGSNAPLRAVEALAAIDAVVATLRRGEAPLRQVELLKEALGAAAAQGSWQAAARALDNFEFDLAQHALADLRHWVAAQVAG